MSQEKYIRLQSGNITEFNWVKTKDDDIIVRYKEDGEIFAVIERPMDQKCLIADAYHQGFTTGINLKQRYIQFLESLTYQLMPDHTEPPSEYIPDYEELSERMPNVFISDEREEGQSEHYVYNIHINDRVIKQVDALRELFEQQYPETFYASACKVWVEDLTPDTVPHLYAPPIDGEEFSIFVSAPDHALYQYLSGQTNYDIKDLLYSAIVEIADSMTKLHASQSNIVPLPIKRQGDPTPAKKRRRMKKVSASSI